MKLSEFINTYAFAMVDAAKKEYDSKSFADVYGDLFFFIPRIYCKDGFNISIQVNYGNYCASENGKSKFGYKYTLVEWGYPSEMIDADKYDAEEPNTTHTVGGYVNIRLLEQLCREHGGFDLYRTLREHIAYAEGEK